MAPVAASRDPKGVFVIHDACDYQRTMMMIRLTPVPCQLVNPTLPVLYGCSHCVINSPENTLQKISKTIQLCHSCFSNGNESRVILAISYKRPLTQDVLPRQSSHFIGHCSWNQNPFGFDF